MVLLDGNVLTALTIDTHPHYRAAVAWFGEYGGRFATCSVTEGRLLRLHMQFGIERSASAAWEALMRVRASPQHDFWDEGFSYANVSYKHVQGHKQITDLWLVTLAQRRGGKVVTFDRGLAAIYPEDTILLTILR